MTKNQNFERPVSSPGLPPSGGLVRAQPGRAVTDRAAAGPAALAAMLEARTVALVGASPRPGTFGQRMVDEVTRSPSRPTVYLVNPRYAEIAGRRCVPSLADIPGPVDLVLLAVPDAALEEQLTLAARRGDRSAVIFGNAHEDPTPASAPARHLGLPPAPPLPPAPSPHSHAPSNPSPHSGHTSTPDPTQPAPPPPATGPAPHSGHHPDPAANPSPNPGPTSTPDPTQPAPPPPATDPAPGPRHDLSPAANPSPHSGHPANSGLPHPGADGASPAWMEVWARWSEPKRTTIQDPQCAAPRDARAAARDVAHGAHRNEPEAAHRNEPEAADGSEPEAAHRGEPEAADGSEPEAAHRGEREGAHGRERAGDGLAGPLRGRLAAIARDAGMQLCGAGCMGFVNVARGLRAIGYTEPDPLPAGSVALVTHSGSVFSAMLRARRGFGYTLAVSSGQELVTPAADYLDYALELPETQVLALVLEAIREPDRLRRVLARAAERDVPVVLLTVGRSASGRMMVNAHSGALAADDGGWEALARAYGVHRVGDLAEFADTVELFAIGRRAARGRVQEAGIATVHDSGLERAHAADLAEEVGVPFAAIGAATKARLSDILDPGLIPANPLDVWGTGADTRELFSGSLIALAEDPSVRAVALAVDLVPELDGDDSYPLAVLDAAERTTKPLAVLGNLASAVDRDLAGQLREKGVPVLEGLRPGLLALRHLLDHADRPAAAQELGRTANPDSPATNPDSPATTAAPHAADARDLAAPRAADMVSAATPNLGGPMELTARRAADTVSAAARAGRRERAAALLAAGAAGAPLLALLREYGITAAETTEAASLGSALAAAEAIGYPVVLKTADPAVTHKSDAHGVILGIRDPAELARAYAGLSARLGPRVLVCETVRPGTELAVGIARDPDLGPLIVVGAGGVLVELLADRSVALPPVDERTARQMIGELRAARLLAGVRGAPPADIDAVVRAITGVSALAEDLGDGLAALDVNPLICGPDAAVAVDALAVLRADG